MPAIFWTGKLSLPMMFVVNANNILAWLTGNAKDTAAMKTRVKQGYDGVFSEHVNRYDELGEEFQTKAATAQLEGVDLQGKEVLDVGAGTGVISLLALRKGASKVVCGDISSYMLEVGRAKADRQGYGADRIDFRQLDAELLPFEDASFDVVMTGMTMGVLPDPEKAVAEMVRVLRSGGLLSIGAHGPEHYWEACDASFRAINKRYVLGYRLEFWPMKEERVRRLLAEAGVADIRTSRIIWRNTFKSGGEAYDFFGAISSNWWYAKFPPTKRDRENRKTRDYFERKGVMTITDDIIIAYGRKP
ncbi:MAG: methyltransferase domain-containing protein [Deltaproteobacteria bacterium]|nr:methyltransferase domain-containing protein [Deltaproteobacteria bacterium]